MKTIFCCFLIASFFLSCASNGTTEEQSDTTVNSITPPPTVDSANAVAPMMGDTTKSKVDSTIDSTGAK